MAQPEGRLRFAGQTAALARADSYEGVLLDLRLLGPRDVDALVALVSVTADSVRSSGINSVGIVVPVADTAAYPGRHLGAATDFLALRMELEPATPGPVTPRDRMSRLIGARAAFDLRWGRALLTPRGRFEFRHEFEQADGQRVRYANWLAGPSFLIDSDGWSRDRFTLSLGIGAALRNAWRLGFDVDGDISGSQRTVGVRLEVAKEF